MKKLFVLSLGILLLSALIFVGCSAPKPAPPPAVKTLDIGEVECLTGFMSDFTKYLPQGTEAARDYINSHGGITINGQKYMINLIVRDNKSMPDAAQSAANDLVYDKGVKFICGSGAAPLTIAIDQVCEQAGVLYCAMYQDGLPDEMGPDHPLKFVSSSGTWLAQYTSLVYLKQIHPEVKTVAVILMNVGQIQYNEPVLNARAATLGITIQGPIIGQPVSLVDLTPIAQTAVSRHADAIMLSNMQTAATGQLLQLIRGLGYTKPIFAGTWPIYEDVLAIAGKDAEGFFGPGFPGNPNIPNIPPITKEVVQTIIDKYGTYNALHMAGFCELYTMVQAIEAAQSFDPKVVAATWEKMTTIDTLLGTGTMGGLKTYGVNHNVYYPIPITTIVNGQLQFATWIPMDQSVEP